MKGLKLLVPVILILSLVATGTYAQELPVDNTAINAGEREDHTKGPDDRVAQANISSTAPGGLWSSPSTWVGGVVPGPGDNVTISPGSAVVIDTAVTVANLTVGPDVSFNIGILTFDPTAARTLTVNGDLTVSGLGLLTTPSAGTVTTHTITVGGNLTNNGILDLSTNSNQAGAGLVFTNASSNTFDGGGPQTNIRTITVDKGTSNVNTLTLSVLNFTIQGSSTDTAASGYLTLTNGTFKISGTFSGSHRTFGALTYTIPATASFWLDNPNYTVTAQNGSAIVPGVLRVSAGIYNVGTTWPDSIMADPAGKVVISGGSINVAAGMTSGFPGANYDQSGGTVTTCIAGNFGTCFAMSGPGTGGDIVIQTPKAVPNDLLPDYWASIRANNAAGTTLHFGNTLTTANGIFTAIGALPNVVIDTTTGPHTLKLPGISSVTMRNINIQSGGNIDIGDNILYITGDTFVNNGILTVKPSSVVNFLDPTFSTFQDITYSGTGSFSALIVGMYIRGNSFTVDPAVSNIRTRGITVDTAHIVNAWKLTLGPPSVFDDSITTVEMIGPASLDFPFNFNLGPSGQKLTYRFPGNRNIGHEVNPGRSLVELAIIDSSDTLTLGGGDLTINGNLSIGNSLIDTGPNRLIHSFGNVIRNFGYIRGTLVHKHSQVSPDYTYFIGDTHCTPVRIEANNAPPPNNPTLISVKTTDAVLPGLPPSTSASVYWTIEQSAPMSSIFKLTYDDQDINGNEQNYGMWRGGNQLPTQMSASMDPASNTAQAIANNLTGTWGIGERLPQISIGGSVLTSGGAGIRNAVVTITGGNLAGPISVQTGSLGTYNFSFLDPGGEYLVTASAKRYRFGTTRQVISSLTSVSNVNFTANPQE